MVSLPRDSNQFLGSPSHHIHTTILGRQHSQDSRGRLKWTYMMMEKVLLTKIRVETSLRFAIDLIPSAALACQKRKGKVVEMEDMSRVYELFWDVKRSTYRVLAGIGESSQFLAGSLLEYPSLAEIAGYGQNSRIDLDGYWSDPVVQSYTKSSNEMIPYTMKGKPLVLSWGQTPRLDSDVRVLLDSGSGTPSILASCMITYLSMTFRFPYYVRYMDIFAFIHTSNHTKVKVVKRERETTVGRTVPLLLVAPDCGESELEASVYKLFDEGGSAKASKEKETVVSDRLLARAVHNAKVRGNPIPTLPFVTSSISATPECEGEDSSHHSGANIAKAEVDSFVRPSVPVITAATTVTSTVDPAMVIKDKIVKPSPISADSTLASGTDPAMGGFMNLSGSDFLIGGIRTDTEAAEAICLRVEASNFEVYKLQDAQLKVVNDKFHKLYTNFVKMTLHLEERFYPHLLTIIAGRRWLLTHGLELANGKCLNTPKYLSALRTVISKAIKKGMQDGLAARITHGMEGHALTNVAAHNPFAEADYVSALQQLQSVNFPLLVELKTNKDARIEDLMNILRLEEHLAKRLGLNESQPHTNHLMVPIHHSLNKIIIGASALSLTLDVSNARIQRIRDDIVNHRSALRNVFTPLAKPFSAKVLMGTKGTFSTVPATVDTTKAFSITLPFASIVTPISVDYYEATSTDDQAASNESVVGESTNPFPNVDDTELVVPQ
ncbi:putative gypsy type transposase [Tanacetum coccineum]|uniref:Gypsy type transposase n=1 Tax=Tanacetum coccineum TaxID=301880 RepID=A0ABQ5EKM5_9ASTR